MDTYKFCIYILSACYIPGVVSLHEETCYRSPSNTEVFVRSQNQTKYNGYTVYEGGVIWTTPHDGDTISLRFSSVQLGRNLQTVDAYQGRNNQGRVLAHIKENVRTQDVSAFGPSVFVDYTWQGVDLSFSVQCTSIEPEGDPNRTRNIVLIIMGVVTLASGLFSAFLVSLKKKEAATGPESTPPPPLFQNRYPQRNNANNSAFPPNITTFPSNNTTLPSNNLAYRSNNPGVQSNNPAYPPTSPTYKPNNPTVQSNNPAYSPTNPTYSPNNPDVQSNNQAYPPTNPTYLPNNPAVHSNNRAYHPTNIAYSPNTPLFPSNNTTQLPNTPTFP